MQESGIDLEFDLHLDDDGTFDLFGEVKQNLSLQDQGECSASPSATTTGTSNGQGSGIPEEDMNSGFTTPTFYELRSTPIER